MVYDERLAERIQDHLGDDPEIVEKKMFGGVAYMLRGNMAIGIHNDGLMVRVDKEEHESVLAEPGVSEMKMGNKTMRGFLVVGAETIAEDQVLASWIDRGLAYAGNLPPK